MVILHLSDIHFGRNNPEYNATGFFQDKKHILDSLIVSICDNTIKPDHIVVTGDIAWFGKKSDFDEALIWFKDLLCAMNLSGENITFCPGNHDVNRSFGNYKTDLNVKNIEIIDEVYEYKNIHKMEAPLYYYEKFCEALGVVPYHYPKNDKWVTSYAIGYKDISSRSGEVFRIVSFNTALLSFINNFPDDQMVIGQAQIIELLNQRIIGTNRKYYTIAIFHHAERFLHVNEICEYNQRCATLPLLRQYVDLVLCGHTETGGITVLYKQIGGAEMLTGGAAYYSDDHANSYSLVIIPDDHKSEGRDIFLLPFTYSLEKGWHRNKKHSIPIEGKKIFLEQPNIICRADFELVLSYGNRNISIPLKCVSISEKDNNTAILNNSEDVCRNLDIICKGPTDKPGKSNITINVASTRETSVEAQLFCENVIKFLNCATKSNEKSYFKIVDTDGKAFLSGESICCEDAADEEVIRFLEKVRKIELKYSVLFQCPNNNTEQRKVDVLNNLIEHGYIDSFRAFTELKTHVSDKTKLYKLGFHSLKKNSLYILHSGTFKCCLYGNSFSIGKLTVLMGPYNTDSFEMLHKAITFIDGDERIINLKLGDDPICYIMTDDKKSEILENLKSTDKCIEIDKMDCVWDNIYEYN